MGDFFYFRKKVLCPPRRIGRALQKLLQRFESFRDLVKEAASFETASFF